MEKTQKLIIVAVVIAVIVAAGLGGVLVLQYNKHGGSDNSDYTTFWQPKDGRYVEYTQIDDSLFNHDCTMRTTITSVNATNAMRDEAWFDTTGRVLAENNWSAPINLTFANGWDINNDMGWPVNVTEVGLENISTRWGERTCIHYRGIWSDGEVDDLWVHNGVMLKFETPPLFHYQAGKWILTSTNIHEVTH